MRRDDSRGASPCHTVFQGCEGASSQMGCFASLMGSLDGPQGALLAPFEPLSDLDLRLLSLKMVFLIAIVSTK